MIYKNYNKETETTLNRERLIADEVSRLTRKYGKSFLDCENLIELTGLGRDNVRALMPDKNKHHTLNTNSKEYIKLVTK